jgi:hypothetical protein
MNNIELFKSFLLAKSLFISFFYLVMLFRLIFLINLFGFISNLTIKDLSYQYGRATDYFSLSYKNIQNTFAQNEQKPVDRYDILFISILIFFFIMLLICLYYQRPFINFLFTLCPKTKNNNNDVDEHVTILHQTPPLKNVKSMYLTVPQSSYIHH